MHSSEAPNDVGGSGNEIIDGDDSNKSLWLVVHLSQRG